MIGDLEIISKKLLIENLVDKSCVSRANLVYDIPHLLDKLSKVISGEVNSYGNIFPTAKNITDSFKFEMSNIIIQRYKLKEDYTAFEITLKGSSYLGSYIKRDQDIRSSEIKRTIYKVDDYVLSEFYNKTKSYTDKYLKLFELLKLNFLSKNKSSFEYLNDEDKQYRISLWRELIKKIGNISL